MPTIKKNTFAQYVQKAQFAQLFNELGWENAPLLKPIAIDGVVFQVNAVAQKSGFFIFTCSADASGGVANYVTRRKIDHQISKIKERYVLIFTHKNTSEQIWQFAKKQSGKPRKIVEIPCTADPESLYQKVRGLFFSLDEEDNITITDVISRVENNLAANADKVTKKFYDHFKREHHAFLGFIKGIDDAMHKDWYASLMLNRLMFCYFIQKKSFLDRNVHYLREKLNESQQRNGKGQFHSFYRDFLRVLFQQGLNSALIDPSVKNTIGQIPYLNGGLFDEHDLEKTYNIQIADEAFESIFNFFDQYDWHLETENGAKGNEINPDVIGYIFEKYINDRAQMGAYYTKEDITEYIAKNCIIPFLFDQTERNGGKMNPIWANLAQAEDRYIYPSVKHGFDNADTMPDDISIGIDVEKPNLLARRNDWNKPATPEHGLPTEIWRETIERWNRLKNTKKIIENGEIRNINDFITHNLDIRLFTEDVIQQTEDADFLRHFYNALAKVTILDPTCGSGAFLFAALNILHPLYEACLERMAAFVLENPNKYRRFEEILADERDTTRHPNREYFIYKKIIVQNLYGVDIMREATEIAKLRLFLKLMSTVEPNFTKPNMGLEPLPDVDFNIRAGNSLVGFATLEEAYTVIRHRDPLFANDTILDISDAADKVKMAFSHFKSRNTEGGNLKIEKGKLKEELKKLNATLNDYLARNYLGDPYKQADFQTWLTSHQPFHWCAEFYEVLYDEKAKFKGFDVVIGNPPYVVYSKKDSKTKLSVADRYKLNNYETLPSNNLYAFTIERSTKISDSDSRIGMIVPISSVSSNNFDSLQKLFSQKLITWQSSYSNRPGKLFENVEQRLTIFIGKKNQNTAKQYFTTSYKHWYANTRENLFPCLVYNENSLSKMEMSFSKSGSDVEKSIKDKLLAKSKITLGSLNSKRSKFMTFYHNGPTYFVRAMSSMPNSGENMQPSSHYKQLLFNEELKNIPTCILNSTLFYFFYKNYSNCRDFSDREINAFPVGELSLSIIEALSLIEQELMKDYQSNKEIKNRFYESGLIYYEEFYPAKSKPLIDAIDKLLAAHYGFSDLELDFILNYDIKYRMGKELSDGEDD